MSGSLNKRPHEDCGDATGSGLHGLSSAPKYIHEDSNPYAKVMNSATHEYHSSYDTGHDVRVPKIPRTESREVDRRSPLLPAYRVSPSLNDLQSDHTIGLEARLETREGKDNTRDIKVESRESKPEYQGAKGDKDVRIDSRVDDIKDTKHERDSYSEYKGNMKIDKDTFAGVSSHLNWKDPKEQSWGKRYPFPDVVSGGNLGPWHAPRTNVHISTEAIKEGVNAENRDYVEACEAVGENRVDIKGDDKFKSKDRKRKDGKLWEWGGDKERNDGKSSTQLQTSSTENKDTLKEERETDRWEREKRDPSKDKDKMKDREKDHLKRDAWKNERDSSHLAKESNDAPGRTLEQETEKKKQKDHDSWKNGDRETRDRRKERDQDGEGERNEKANKYNDNDSEEVGVPADGGGDREREGFNYGVQQRKRMLRPRGSPQMGSRDPRSRTRIHDHEGSQGKLDTNSIVYRVGECMQELIKAWKEYESSQAEKVGDSAQAGPTLEIRIPAEHVSATNRQVRGGQLWGTDVYTDDSDLVAVLMHTGYCRPTASPPPPTIQELRATIRVLPPQESYVSSLRNNVRSRAWGSPIGCSYRVEHCCIVKKGGGTIDLEPCLTHSSTMEPTLAPVAVERTMTTRAAASNALRQQKFVREVTIQYNLCNEPWLKYSISVVADKGLKKPLFTSARLKKGEVLYLETHTRRYELCFQGEKMVKATGGTHAHEVETEKHHHNHHSTSTSVNGDKNVVVDGENVIVDVFRWSRCKKPLPQKMMRSLGIPLPLDHVEVLEENLEWEDIQWSQTGVWVAGKEYPLARAHFLSPN
ncbi:unnamed protein product [Cuscuta epithymum]|uniref:Histone deacetylation protein Rxt3 n=1 Tax=Cuscuta epithymum TaxID=186058 RepID=A0AAV0DKW2_9ASTE|nr:unnamed protein product [Cuscuta epithymum]CAH9121353.1 unnamed protein product [Cuscuta epithymum]